MFNNFLYTIIRTLLFSFNPESTHHVILSILKSMKSLGLTKLIQKPKIDAQTVMNLQFLNPVGLAAGFDKNGIYIDSLATLGFGSIEIGTITPRAQLGNTIPRLFRLPQAKAIINRMGFNNLGVDAFIVNIKNSHFYQNKQGILGLNIGKNADTPIEHAVDDYLYCLKKVYPYADYITINISSPNTKHLQELQNIVKLNALLIDLKTTQQKLADQYKHYVPLVIKISPDINNEQIKNIAAVLLRHKIDGIIATNTTTTRDTVKNLPHGKEVGGLSGAPIFALSNKIICRFKAELGDTLPIIGVGGILHGKDAITKIQAGATLIQLYSGLIYRGPSLIKECIDILRSYRTSKLI